MAIWNFVIKHHNHHRHRHQHGHRKWHHVLCLWITLWLLVVCMPYPVLPEVIYRVDPLALLAATLRTYQRAGCDSEQLSLSCPRGTSISIELAQYGRAGDLSDHSLCPPISQEDLTTTDSTHDAVVHSGTEIEIKPPETCTVSGLQYVLLQTVVDACQKKRHCKFAASPKAPTSSDPCSGIRKFVEIAYKCRPYEFRSKVACENDNMPLVCNPYSRIAIYSASFGHIERETVQCGHGSAVPDNSEDASKQTCLVSYATETVMQICHGRRRCSITADAGTFGRPCKNDVRMYLKVVYTCIPRKVLKDRYETAPEADEPHQTESDLDQDDLYDEDQFYKESEAIPPAPKLQGAIPNPSLPFDFNMGTDGRPPSTLLPPLLSRNENSLEEYPTGNENNSSFIDGNAEAASNYFLKRKCQQKDEWGFISLNCTEEDTIIEKVKVIGFLAQWMEAYVHIRKNQEQFYLYLIISVAAGVLLCLTLVIGRLTLQRRRAACRKNSCSNSINSSKICSDTIAGVLVGNVGAELQPPSAAAKAKLPNSFGDDISDIDGDIDLTSPIAVSSLSSRNESYLTYAPTSSCAYAASSLVAPPTTSLSTGTAVLIPNAATTTASHHSGLLATGHSNHAANKSLVGSAGGIISRQTPPPNIHPGLYTSIGGGICSPTVSGAMTMGPHVLTASTLNSSQLPAGVTSYLAGTMIVPSHNHAHIGTLRRAYIPTSIGVMRPTHSQTSSIAMPPHSLAGIPSTSNSVYYDSTIPRNLNRGMSADNAQCFYG